MDIYDYAHVTSELCNRVHTELKPGESCACGFTPAISMPGVLAKALKLIDEFACTDIQTMTVAEFRHLQARYKDFLSEVADLSF